MTFEEIVVANWTFEERVALIVESRRIALLEKGKS